MTLVSVAQRLVGCAGSRAYNHECKDWLVGGKAAFEVEKFGRSMLEEEDLEKPVVLVYGDCHGWYTNADGLKRAGYDLAGGDFDRAGGQHTPRAGRSLTGNVMDQAECRLMAAVAKPLVMYTTSVMMRTGLETYHNGTMSC